jgi:hypothetical protein
MTNEISPVGQIGSHLLAITIFPHPCLPAGKPTPLLEWEWKKERKKERKKSLLINGKNEWSESMGIDCFAFASQSVADSLQSYNDRVSQLQNPPTTLKEGMVAFLYKGGQTK